MSQFTLHPSRKSGFSLLEVMIAFAIFAIVMTSVVWTMMFAQRMGQSARNRLAALQQARATLEELVGRSYTSSSLDTGTYSVDRGGFTGTYVVTEPAVNEMKRVIVRMDYPSFRQTAVVELQMELSHALRR